MTRQLRIAQVAPPLEPVPPRGYGGTERVIDALVTELGGRGHAVTTFASGDSTVAGELVATVPRALRAAGLKGDVAPWFYATIQLVLDRAREFDVIHSHLEWASPLLERVSPIPVVSTFHGRLDVPWADRLIHDMRGAVAISRSQAASRTEVRWAGVVHNGLALDALPFAPARDPHLVFVGRVAPEKGIVEAIGIARRADRPLRIIAKRPALASEIEYHESVFGPALEAAGSLVEDLGELSGLERDAVVARSYASLMPGRWPEPFGLAAIEALACGTPVLTYPVGALPEIVRDGVDGFLGDDEEHLARLVDRVEGLDRAAIRESVLERFSAARMTAGYEAVYAGAIAATGRGRVPITVQRVPVPVGPGPIATADQLRERLAEHLGDRADGTSFDDVHGTPLREAVRRAVATETRESG